MSPRSSGEEKSQRFPFSFYATLNNTIATIGFLFVMLCITLQSRGVMTGLLLCIGLFFLIQMATIAIPFWHGLLPVQRPAPEPKRLPQTCAPKAIRLFNVLPLVPVVVAVSLYIVYFVIICIQWDQFAGHQISKLASITFTNLIFAGTIFWTYRKLKSASAEGAAERYSELTRVAPTIVFGSILVTLYFFTKEIMFGLDLHELRPSMMSGFLQLIAIAVFHTLWHVDADNRTMA